jgi:hypothetical protein
MRPGLAISWTNFSFLRLNSQGGEEIWGMLESQWLQADVSADEVIGLGSTAGSQIIGS